MLQTNIYPEAVRPSTPIKLDRDRNMIITLNALCLIEEKTGRSVMNQASWASLSLRDLRTMLWASLREEDPTLTERQVGEWLDLGNMPEVVGLVSQAWNKAMTGEASPLEVKPVVNEANQPATVN